MKPIIPIVIFLLPFATLALYDESSTRKLKLEDIEEEHLQSERQSKTSPEPQSLPPPLSKQPAKGQPTKIYPPIAKDRIQEYHKENPSTTHRYSTRAQQNVQPLTDQPSAPEADYQQSPAYQSETIVYLPPNAHGQPLLQGNTLQQQQFDVVQQPSSPLFYYSHDIQSPQQQQSSGNGYQLEYIPIGGSDGQHTYAGPQVTVPQADAGNSQIVSYSHGSGFGGGAQVEAQQQEPVRYVTTNEIREPNNVQHVYGLPPSVFFESQKDIEYAKPTNTYGPPQQSYPKGIVYSQPIPIQKPTTYENQQKPIEYSSVDESQPAPRPATAYGPPESPKQYFAHQKDIEYAQQVETEIAQKPSITYGPPDTVGHIPQIQYGVPDAPFRRPGSQSNQNAYAPRRPDSSGRSNEKPFAISFPYPPSFVSITTQRPFYENSTPTPEPSYNEVSQWQANVMPLHLIPPQETQYRSFGTTQAAAPNPSSGVTQHIESHPAPLIDFFHTRRAKSLLDSYIPSWLVSRMQEEHARQLQQQNQHQQQAYAIPSPAAETGYNTIAYSTQFENIYGKDFKRSIPRNKGHQKKKANSAEELSAVA